MAVLPDVQQILTEVTVLHEELERIEEERAGLSADDFEEMAKLLDRKRDTEARLGELRSRAREIQELGHEP